MKWVLVEGEGQGKVPVEIDRSTHQSTTSIHPSIAPIKSYLHHLDPFLLDSERPEVVPLPVDGRVRVRGRRRLAAAAATIAAASRSSTCGEGGGPRPDERPPPHEPAARRQQTSEHRRVVLCAAAANHGVFIEWRGQSTHRG